MAQEEEAVSVQEMAGLSLLAHAVGLGWLAWDILDISPHHHRYHYSSLLSDKLSSPYNDGKQNSI